MTSEDLIRALRLAAELERLAESAVPLVGLGVLLPGSGRGQLSDAAVLLRRAADALLERAVAERESERPLPGRPGLRVIDGGRRDA